MPDVREPSGVVVGVTGGVFAEIEGGGQVQREGPADAVIVAVESALVGGTRPYSLAANRFRLRPI